MVRIRRFVSRHFVTVRAGVIALNKVKLPAPSASDYVSPKGASASSAGIIDLSALVLRRHAGGITNEPNIYDENDGTYAYPTATIPAGIETEIMVWDLGVVRKITLKYKMYGYYCSIRLYRSEDDVTYDLIDKTDYGKAETKTGTVTITARYIKWMCYDPSETSGINFRLYTVDIYDHFYTVDDNLTTKWRPSPANEANAWCQWDTGALRILGGCRIYWGADTAYLPSEYKIQLSEDGTTWVDVVHETSAPPAGAWKEYSWNARYGRYLRLLVITHGSSGTEIYEMDYYSRITDRVAAEHGHGSSIVGEPITFSEGHPKMRFGETYREKTRAKGRAAVAGGLSEVLEYIKALEEEIEFLRGVLV